MRQAFFLHSLEYAARASRYDNDVQRLLCRHINRQGMEAYRQYAGKWDYLDWHHDRHIHCVSAGLLIDGAGLRGCVQWFLIIMCPVK